MVFMTINPIMGVNIFAMFWHNVRKQLKISLKLEFELKHCMVGDETHSSKMHIEKDLTSSQTSKKHFCGFVLIGSM
jgi:hypothetical protein